MPIGYMGINGLSRFFRLTKTSGHGWPVKIVAGDEQARQALFRVPEAGDALMMSNFVLRQTHWPVLDTSDSGFALCADKIAEFLPGQSD